MSDKEYAIKLDKAVKEGKKEVLQAICDDCIERNEGRICDYKEPNYCIATKHIKALSERG